METQLDYGNWIRKKNLVILGLCTLGMGALTFIPLGSLYRLVTTILFAAIFISFLFPLYAYVMFSQKGGKLQEKIYNSIIQSLETNVKGRILDIGSGNGVLTVKLAQQNKEAEIVGMDYWGADWEYSKSICEKNAKLGDVESRVRFQKGDAASLDFATGEFDGAVSNLTFHEVRSVADKRLVLREALRVVKLGGAFAFVDYFYEEKYYGASSELKKYLQGMGLTHFEYKSLRDLIAIPSLLNHPKIFGKVGIIYGRK
ncbi:MAG: class I SAM-dependent methyltransferase [Anaerolineales bacterium]|nr:class I SAM-dependent methyltransferase [Anaerolineales bacterium]